MPDELLPNTGRRSFLVRSTTMAGAGFLSIALPPALGGSDAEAAISATPAYTPSIWVTITPDGVTTMHIVKAEMGQHIGTAFAQIIAEELEVPWEKVRLDMPLESNENFGIYGLAYTVNSGSVTTEFDRLSRAGALGRMVLVEAGAKLLGAKLANCYASAGRVIDKASKRSVGYGDILQKVKLEKSFSYPNDFKAVKLKARSEYKIIGKSVPALDIPAKTNGSAKYAMDVFLPNMAYGALAIPRTRHMSKVLSVDDSAASLALIESVATTMCCMVSSMRFRLPCASAVALVV
jgi:CO/xanthine dehydrogenase Mo-binding subunit